MTSELIGSIPIGPNTFRVNVHDANVPAVSVAVIFKLTGPPDVGVPQSVLVCGSKFSHEGKLLPLPNVAEYDNVLLPSSSIKVVSANV